MRYILLVFLIISVLTTTPASAVEKTAILLGQDYFQTTHHAIQEAKESIYIAMYLINVEPTPTDNPASILLEGLINAHKRGVFVKIILDDTKFSINYNACKRLKDAGVDAYLDSPQTVLHGKGIVIDPQICILGSFNWSRASLYDNYEFATYIEDSQLARTLLDYFNRIELSPEIPLLPQQYPGLKLPLSLLTATPKSPLSELFTSHSEKAFDLYLYLAKKACELSAQLNEPKDLQKIETYIDLINTYGYERVEEVNSQVASKRRETGFHDISQVVLLLKKNPR